MRMSPEEIEHFGTALSSAHTYLEYGAGGSTKLAAACATLNNITSVESDPGFIDSQVRTDLPVRAAEASGRLRFLIVDVGPTGDWGLPLNGARIHLWPNYALCPYLHGYLPDLILIDGRFRVACGLAAALQAPEATVLVHDYSIRADYHVLEEFFTITKRVDTLVECKRKQTFSERSARTLLRHYLYSPTDDSQTRQARSLRFLNRVKRRLVKR